MTAAEARFIGAASDAPSPWLHAFLLNAGVAVTVVPDATTTPSFAAVTLGCERDRAADETEAAT